MKTMMTHLPFPYKTNESFFDKLNEWIGDVFYDILPEAGMELRDEQIFMAFQLEKAFTDKKIMFAEAGVGTGKTIAYLLYAICYARYMRKPVIISCADESLIEQLVKKEGDIAKISSLLNLSIDARLAKSKDQYLCLQKLDIERSRDEYDEKYDEVYDALPDFVMSSETMQSFYHYGDRKEYSSLSDEAWEKIGWDRFQDCFVCEKRHRCGQTLSREHYRKAADLIICSHDFYMEHVWTSDARKREGQLPLLPESSAVIFDEGHLLEVAAQKALTYKLRHDVLEDILTRLLKNDVREEFALLIDDLLSQSFHLSLLLKENLKEIVGSTRHEMDLTAPLLKEFTRFLDLIAKLEDEMVFESEMYTIDSYELKIVEEHLEMIHKALHIFVHQKNAITWVEKDEEGVTLVIMPRMVEEVLKEKVFSKNIPFIFSSATLSTNSSFEYMAESLGIDDYLSFSVSSPFDYGEQMQLFVPTLNKEDLFNQKIEHTNSLLTKTNGKALLLFSTHEELRQFKERVQNEEAFKPWRFIFEGEKEITELISLFQRDTDSVLCAVSLWEGLDIPGEALSNVIIWSLPFPPQDPVFAAKRKGADDSFWEVDVPYMLLRLRQGIGRLIRTHHDRGWMTIFSEQINEDEKLFDVISGILPAHVQMKKYVD